MTAALQIGSVTPHSSLRLERVFAGCFADSEATRLVGGAAEPLYVPAGDEGCGDSVPWHRLYYREDFFASALHEVAHWCIAGARRRLLRDFGYWYRPDGRGPAEQAAFQAVEARPQALEWFFARACAYPFRVSLDNLESNETAETARGAETAFKRAVVEQANGLRAAGLPPRARRYFESLSREFASGASLEGPAFTLEELGRNG